MKDDIDNIKGNLTKVRAVARRIHRKAFSATLTPLFHRLFACYIGMEFNPKQGTGEELLNDSLAIEACNIRRDDAGVGAKIILPPPKPKGEAGKDNT